MKYSEIPQLTRSAHYSVNADWNYLLDRIADNDNELNLDPDFQRGHVWTEEQQIAYVEFKLRGGEGSDVLMFNHPGWQSDFKGDYVIVDGKQRITAVIRFLKNEIKAFGKYRKEYEGRIPYHANFIWKVNDLQTRAEVLRWYLELNTGGTPHTNEEITKVEQLLKDEKNT